MNAVSVKDFYKDVFGNCCPDLEKFLDDCNNKDIGHFNVFNIASLYTCKTNMTMPYNRRTYYKISLISGNNRVEYADKTVDITGHAVLFATPKIPYRYTPLDNDQAGHFCVFTKDFLAAPLTGLAPDELPIFRPGGDFVYKISPEQYRMLEDIFEKMHAEMSSDYAYKYDLLRNYTLELVHYGQKLQPALAVENTMNASARISSLFIELLERQFPIESASQVLQLKTAGDYAGTLGVHVNHLNKVLKDTTGRTTTEVIASRLVLEAKVLLKQTSWNISEIANSLGFEEVAHFSNFFKKHVGQSPLAFREEIFEFYK
jgi:AraC-like DNA-binding protein